MHLFYIDDSHERHFFTFCAIGIPADNWKAVFAEVREYRVHLRKEYGIFLWKELHAWKFTSGRGRPSDREIRKEKRCDIYRETLAFLAGLHKHNVILFSSTSREEYYAYERLLNRINRTMKAQSSYATLFCDEGNEVGFRGLARKMSVFNYIPSKYGAWSDGKESRNIPTERILEDPVFRPSHESYLIQMADFCAYALLRKEKPHPAKTALGLSTAFNLLEPICFKQANRRDPYGIVKDG